MSFILYILFEALDSQLNIKNYLIAKLSLHNLNNVFFLFETYFQLSRCYRIMHLHVMNVFYDVFV